MFLGHLLSGFAIFAYLTSKSSLITKPKKKQNIILFSPLFRRLFFGKSLQFFLGKTRITQTILEGHRFSPLSPARRKLVPSWRLALELQRYGPLQHKAVPADAVWYGWWKKCCTSWYGRYPVIYKVLYIPGGAGFLPSAAHNEWDWNVCLHLTSFFCLNVSKYSDSIHGMHLGRGNDVLLKNVSPKKNNVGCFLH